MKDNADKHSKKERIIMRNYYEAVDVDLLNLIRDVENNRASIPVTVGYLNESQCKRIKKALDTKREVAPRCVIDASAIAHILKKHGPKGKSDQSLSDINDIARLPYVLANFDSVSFEGKYSKRFRDDDGQLAPQVMIKKKIDGTYYVIEAIPSGKRKKSYIVSARIEKRVEL